MARWHKNNCESLLCQAVLQRCTHGSGIQQTELGSAQSDSIRITIPFLLLIAEKRCLSRLDRKRCGSIVKGSVSLSTRGAWTGAKRSTSWNTTFHCWKRKAGQSSMPGQCRIPCLETFWIGYKSSVYLPKNWLSSCGGAKRKTVTRL